MMIWFLLVVALLTIGWFCLRTLPCPSWLGWMVEMDNPFCREARAATVLGHLNLKEGMRILDFGCGPGRLAIPAAKAVGPTGRVVALDLQPKMLERVRAKGGSNIQLMDAQELLPQDEFDRALLVSVLGEVPDRHATLKRIYRSLKPGGILSITETLFDPHYLRMKTLRHLCADVGFSEVALFGGRLAYTALWRKSG